MRNFENVRIVSQVLMSRLIVIWPPLDSHMTTRPLIRTWPRQSLRAPRLRLVCRASVLCREQEKRTMLQIDF